MDVSWDTFYRYRDAVEHSGVEARLGKSRRKPNINNRVDEAAERAVCHWTIASPAHGQARTRNELRSLFRAAACAVRSIWLRHGLESFRKRLTGAGRQGRTRTGHSDKSAGVLSGDVPQAGIPRWKNYKPILTCGSCTTIMTARIKARCVAAEGTCVAPAA